MSVSVFLLITGTLSLEMMSLLKDYTHQEVVMSFVLQKYNYCNAGDLSLLLLTELQLFVYNEIYQTVASFFF